MHTQFQATCHHKNQTCGTGTEEGKSSLFELSAINEEGDFYKNGEGKQNKEIKEREMQKAAYSEKVEHRKGRGLREIESATSELPFLIMGLSLFKWKLVHLLQTLMDPHSWHQTNFP